MQGMTKWSLSASAKMMVASLLIHDQARAQAPSGPADFGDLPDLTIPSAPIRYQTRLADGGPWHSLGSQIFLGATVDAETDGLPTNASDGDDLNGGPDDEDGITIPASIKAGTGVTFQATVTNLTTSQAFLHAFIDWNGDGVFVGGQETCVIPVPSGTSAVNVPIPFHVPSGATTTHPVGARFRLSTLALDPSDPAPDGEIEDEMITIIPPDLDFGDLPDSSVGASPAYATQLSDNGARHAVSSDLFLGPSAPDIELDGIPDVAALGDDNDASDDEEGFTPLTGIQAGTTVAFQQDVTNQKTNAAWLHGFFDWNRDGDFMDLNESVKVAIPPLTIGGTATLSVLVPIGLPYSSDIPARLRLTSLQSIGPDGFAPDGEVEDYFLSVEPALDFGDLPDVATGTAAGDFISVTPDYQTVLSDNGPRHLVTPGLVFQNDTGSADADIDAETDAFQSANADGDDGNGDDDELRLLTAVTSLSATSGGAPDCSDIEIGVTIALSHSIKNDFPIDATLHTFIDWNHDGDFLDADESWSQIIPAGTNGAVLENVSHTFPWPGTTSWTEIYAVRSRLTTNNSITAVGYAPDGEVQDDLASITYAISDPCPEPNLDFGDLPDSRKGTAAGSFDYGNTLPDYRTTLADNGPRHVITTGLSISNDSGSSDADIDAEADGQPTADADGDDNDGNNDDLNLLSALTSVTFNAATPIDHSTLTLTILTDQAVTNTTGSDATFYAFLDGNRDGDFSDPGEGQSQIILGDGSATNAQATFSVTIPWTGDLTWEETFAVRFRISTDAGLGANGAAPDGEVQDHLLTFQMAVDDPRPQGSGVPCFLEFD